MLLDGTKPGPIEESVLSGMAKCCFFFLGFVMITLSLVSLIVSLVMAKKSHYQIMITGIGMISLLPSFLLLGFLVLKKKVGKTYLYLLLLMLFPFIFSGANLFSSIKIRPADDFKNCTDGTIWQASNPDKKSKCIKCGPSQCLNFHSFLNGTNPCEEVQTYDPNYFVNCSTCQPDSPAYYEFCQQQPFTCTFDKGKDWKVECPVYVAYGLCNPNPRRDITLNGDCKTPEPPPDNHTIEDYEVFLK